MTVGYIDIKRIDLSSLTLVDGTYSFIYPSYRMKVIVVCFLFCLLFVGSWALVKSAICEWVTEWVSECCINNCTFTYSTHPGVDVSLFPLYFVYDLLKAASTARRSARRTTTKCRCNSFSLSWTPVTSWPTSASVAIRSDWLRQSYDFTVSFHYNFKLFDGWRSGGLY